MIEDKWVEGDNISYSCAGDGETDDDIISVCEHDGQWSLQTLPDCCKISIKNSSTLIFGLFLSIIGAFVFIPCFEVMKLMKFFGNKLKKKSLRLELR